MGIYKRFQVVKSIFSEFAQSRQAAVLPLAALAFPVVLSIVGLGTDAGYWMAEQRRLQNAADAGAVAAAWEFAQSSEAYMDNAAYREAVTNGYKPGENGALSLQLLSSDDDGVVIGLTLEQDTRRFFTNIISSDPVRISTYAEAEVSGMDGRFCVLALDETGSDSVGTFGSAVIDAPDCGIAANSESDEALTLSGSSDITIGTIRVTGDYDIGSNVDLTYDSLKTGQRPIDDPYADLEVPEYEGCDENRMRVSSSTTLSPGVYCGGINISGNNDIVFEPGVYILDGGDFKVTGGGSMYGEGVTFILTGQGNNYAGLDISGSRDIEFSSPLSGEEWSGIAFFQDRNAPDRDNYQNKLTGSGEIVLNGVAYFPSQGLWFGGDATMTSAESPCTKLIARTVTLAGNPLLGNSCDPYDVADIGLPEVHLIR